MTRNPPAPPPHPAIRPCCPVRRRLLASAAGFAALGPGAHRGARAQSGGRFPDRPISLLVPFAAGGIADLTARAVGEQMARILGQAVVVENRPSAGSIVASQAVATARPDGHTLLLMSNGHAVSVSLFRKLPYDPVKDFTPISTLGSFDIGLFVPASSRFQTLTEAVAWARNNPGKLNVGTIAVGSTQHLAAKLFETVAGVDALVVPYKASPAVLTALRSGEVDLAFEVTGPMVPQVQAGAVRALAVTGEVRNASLPDVPTVQQAGVPGYQVASWNALAAPAGTPPEVVAALNRAAPAGTPPEVVATLNRAAREAVASAAVQDKLGRMGMRLAASSPAELSSLLSSEIRRWGEVIRRAKIEPE